MVESRPGDLGTELLCNPVDIARRERKAFGGVERGLKVRVQSNVIMWGRYDPVPMTDAILTALREIELEHDVRVLYAVESGSRAWGFASADSDFDVRFIYANRPEWYLSIHEKRDVIEKFLPGDLDVSGWDLRKALRLLQKSNPPLLEWLFSPIVYFEDLEFTKEIRQIAVSGWSPKHCMHHYLSMADGNFRTYLQGDLVRSKKYLYVLRPLLACRWIERTLTLPPVLFRDMLVAEPDDAFIGAVENLLARKSAGLELDNVPRDPVLHAFITSELARHQEGLHIPHQKMDPERLDQFFRRIVSASERRADG